MMLNVSGIEIGTGALQKPHLNKMERLPMGVEITYCTQSPPSEVSSEDETTQFNPAIE